ncbi:hypothetical protein Mgra_00007698 [Meloidogyne graminicola]|uniref:EGF-like domain-containing protein n=1 Tax=Meloidogyne graminicola TaxID=189291 RepID=A0A8S9ZI89_9BILA|nr:hypothetical protein Mgra_00007698 [Meloidogyne graminicola]
MDGVCPEDGRRWCYRGVCLWEDGKATCLCPPGLLGEQCELENKQFDEEINNIEFNGKNSLLAFSLNSTENEGEIDENNGFLVEFRLNPTQTSFDEEQLLALLMREKDSQVLAAVTMLPQNGRNSQLGDIIQKCLAIAPSYAFTFLQYKYQQIQ